MQNADPKYFSIEGIENSLVLGPKMNGSQWEVSKVRHCGDGSYEVDASAAELQLDPEDARSRGFCQIGTQTLFSNDRKDPPCLVLIGNSHMDQHRETIAGLAEEYGVSLLFLTKGGANYKFEDPPKSWDIYRIDMLEKYRPKRVAFIPTEPYRKIKDGSGLEIDEIDVTLDALMSSDPEKVLVMGDNPSFAFFGEELTADVFKPKVISAVQEGRLKDWKELSEIRPIEHREKLGKEAKVAKAIEDNPKYRKVVEFHSTYPAFMDANNTFIQLIGVETEGGNKMLFKDNNHVNQDGSNRLREYFREHLFKDLNCTAAE